MAPPAGRSHVSDAVPCHHGMSAVCRRVPPDVLSLSHRRMRRRVETLVDGELDIRAAKAVRQHLDDCPGCSGYAELLAKIKASLARLESRRPPALASVRLRRWSEDLAAGGLG